jgi:riboflavin-specific deaminase-like protein
VQTLFPSAASDLALDEMVDGYAYPAIAGARWWLRAVMVCSVDGAVTGPDGRSGSISSTSDRVLFRHLRAQPDAVIVGAGTARAEDYGQPSEARLVVVSRSLSLDPQSRLFDGPGRVVVATSRSADWNAVERLAQVADVVRVGDDEVDLTELVGLLADQGLQRLQCEGGPALLGDIAAAGLLDELCLSTVPTIVGGKGARIVTGAAADPAVGLALTSLVRADDGTLFSRWRRY